MLMVLPFEDHLEVGEGIPGACGAERFAGAPNDAVVLRPGVVVAVDVDEVAEGECSPAFAGDACAGHGGRGRGESAGEGEGGRGEDGASESQHVGSCA